MLPKTNDNDDLIDHQEDPKIDEDISELDVSSNQSNIISTDEDSRTKSIKRDIFSITEYIEKKSPLIENQAKKARLAKEETSFKKDSDSDIEIITLDSGDEETKPVKKVEKIEKVSVKVVKDINKYDSDPEIIELSDSEPEIWATKPTSSSMISLYKNEKSHGQQLLAPFKDMNVNNGSDDIMIVSDIPGDPNYHLQSNPSQLDKKDLQAKVALGLNSRQTCKNQTYEEQIRLLIEPMFKSIESKPDPEKKIEDFIEPKSLKVKLLPHQVYSMQWLKWRENEFPHGAILADDMGLGKTLTILSYLKLVKDGYEKKYKEKHNLNDSDEQNDDINELDNDFDAFKYLTSLKINKKQKDEASKRLKTLIVLPASLLHQWQGEIANKFEKNAFKIHVYHEGDRKKFSYNLENNDIVFTTYEIISRECTIPDKEGYIPKSDSPLANIKWKRIILDEAHRIKNHTTKANKAMCTLKAKYRITITGTPVHNSLNDLYSLVKFLHFEPLDDFGLWKYLFASETFSAKSLSNKENSEAREKRVGFWLKFLSDYLILRRTKKDKFTGTDKCIVDLPEKRIEEVRFKLNPGESAIYQKIFKESQDKVNKFLDDHQNRLIGLASGKPKGNNVSEIFVYLLRLRQACCHMSLLSECLDKAELENHQIEDNDDNTQSNASKYIDDLQNDSFDSDENSNSSGDTLKDDLDTLKEIKSDNLLKCLNKSYMSSKIDKSISMITDLVNEFPDDKLIIVSQWTSVLSIIGSNLKRRNIEYCEIKGDVMLSRRNEIVEEFNDKSNTSLKVMLLSLTAGGVGLNLIGANRMFLLDIHWNPALEQQCADRIYRVGQTKNVTIYKLLCEETIEERIQQIQQTKIQIAERVCRSGAESAIPGVPGNTKLTIRDFKLLFQDFNTK